MCYKQIIVLEHGKIYISHSDKFYCEIKRDWVDEYEYFDSLDKAIDWYTDWCERYIVSNFE